MRVSNLLNTTNINTNSGSAAFDVSTYTGTLFVLLNAGNGVPGTLILPSIKAGADTNISNATNWVVNATNFSNVASLQMVNVDLRSAAFGGSDGTGIINNQLFLTWLVTGSATANSAITATVIGEQKYSS